MTAKAAPRRPPMELWHRALTDPSLRDLPYKVETNQYGQLVLSPRTVGQSLRQAQLLRLLHELPPAAGLPPGEAVPGFAIETEGGIKVPDVVWMSVERLARLPEDAEASPVMPEIVVEVLSRSNTLAEMEEKRRLYFAAGAQEVWMCDPEGRLIFYGAEGELPTSQLIPSFPPLVA